MYPQLLLLLLQAAAWATLYSFDQGRIYMHLANNDLVALNFSVTGLDALSKYSMPDVNYHTGQHVGALSTPPAALALFLWQGGLYAFSGSPDREWAAYDRCGDGGMRLLRYHADRDAWENEPGNLTFADVDDMSYYAGSTYLASPDSNTIYIYGGQCQRLGRMSGRLLLFDMRERRFANVSTSTTPQMFSGAASVWAPTPHQTLVMGGRSPHGWLNMAQIASWDFLAGWLSIQVANGSGVESRTGALALPVFRPLSAASRLLLLAEYTVLDMLVVGGVSADGAADWVRLRYDRNTWAWSRAVLPPAPPAQVLGAAVIFNTLVVVTSGSRPRSDAVPGYRLGVYSVSDMAEMSDLSASEAAAAAAADHRPVPQPDLPPAKLKVLVGTLVPLAALGMAALAGFLFWKHRRHANDRHGLVEPLEYQFGHFSPSLTASLAASLLLREKALRRPHIHDLVSTLDVGSMDSWVRKRQEYDAALPVRPGPLRTEAHAEPPLGGLYSLAEPLVPGLIDGSPTHASPIHGHPPGPALHDEGAAARSNLLNRASYLASSETLHSFSKGEHSSAGPAAAVPNLAGGDADQLGRSDQQRESDQLGRSDQLRGSDHQRRKREHMARLGKSFSYSRAPPRPCAPGKTPRPAAGADAKPSALALEDESIDENVDVQVLVSSKRRSVLRVANPDEPVGSSRCCSLRQSASFSDLD